MKIAARIPFIWRSVGAALALALLAGCGADDEPAAVDAAATPDAMAVKPAPATADAVQDLDAAQPAVGEDALQEGLDTDPLELDALDTEGPEEESDTNGVSQET